MQIILVLSVVAAASAGLIPAGVPATYLTRVPSLDSAVIKSDRLGGNFAYSVSEAHAYAAHTPVVQQIATPVAVSYSAPAIQTIAAPAPVVQTIAAPAPVALAAAPAPTRIVAPITLGVAPGTTFTTVQQAAPAFQTFAAPQQFIAAPQQFVAGPQQFVAAPQQFVAGPQQFVAAAPAPLQAVAAPTRIVAPITLGAAPGTTITTLRAAAPGPLALNAADFQGTPLIYANGFGYTLDNLQDISTLLQKK